MRTVFISYNHQDRDLLPSLLAQLKALEQVGLLDVWVDTRIDAGEKWYPEIEAAMKRAAVAVCLVSEHFLASDFCTKEEVPFLMKRAAEEGLLVIPVLLSDCPWYAHRWVQERQMLPGEGQCVRTHFANNPAAVFARVARRIFDKLNDPAFQPPPSRVRWPALPPDRVDLSRLPETGSALFGRDEELKLLDAAWADSLVASAATRVLAFTAHGGVGKSTLLNHWLDEMKHDHFRGATRVFGWSFYSQGLRDQGAASADSFVDASLRFFGDPDPTAGSPWDKGERLARLVGAERALLVLDGLEPLQSAQAFDRGKLRDPALESLLRGLARQSAGLCVITTREPIADLAGRPGVTSRDLEQITPQAGRALLRVARVVGTDAELEALAERFGPHALAVSLLGVYLHEQPGHGLGPAKALEQLPGEKPVDRVLTGFEQWLGDSPQFEALRLLGFFDRPADAGCLRALRAKPVIPGLTDHLAGLDDAEWNLVLARLEKLRLIHVRQSESGQQFVDAHPLIREHFAAELKEGSAGVPPAAVGVSPTASSPIISFPTGIQGRDASQRDAGLGTRDARAPQDAWREGHRRLYEYLCATTPDKPEPTLEDLQPFYQAVAHGCQAGITEEARVRVYRDRIQRGQEVYSTKKLGALGSDLGAIASFFKQPWSGLLPGISDGGQAWLLNEAAFRLRALGRPAEALEPARANLKMRVEREEWQHAPSSASNLSELELTLGEVRPGRWETPSSL